jgi:hypothetical protein
MQLRLGHLPLRAPLQEELADDWSSGSESDPEDTAARRAMSRAGKRSAAALSREARVCGGKRTAAKLRGPGGAKLREARVRGGKLSGAKRRAKAKAAKEAAAAAAASVELDHP